MNSERDTSINDFERIEAFLTGHMNEADRVQFELEIRNDPAFAEKVTMQQEMLRTVEVGALREKFEKIHQVQIGKAGKPSRSKIWYAIAAGFALLIASGIWWQSQPNEFQALLANNLTTDPGLPVPMSAPVGGQYIFYDAMVDYKMENYELAMEKWNKLLSTGPKNDTLQFYIGAALFNQSKYAGSLSYFEKVLKNEQSTFRYKSQWYIVLASLAGENKAKIDAVKPLPGSPFTGQINTIQSQIQD